MVDSEGTSRRRAHITHAELRWRALGRCLRRTPGWLWRLAPHWLVAAVLAFAAEVVGVMVTPYVGRFAPYLVYAPLPILFAVGGLIRLNWRHILIMLGVGVGSCVVATGMHILTDDGGAYSSVLPYPYGALPTLVMLAAALGMGELLLVGKRAVRPAVWMVVFCLSAVALGTVAALWIAFSGWVIDLRSFGGLGAYTLDRFLSLPAYAAATWAMVPLALRATRSVSRKVRALAKGSALLSIVVFLAFFEVLLVPLAKRSASGNGPFTRESAGGIIRLRGSAADADVLWRELEKADWPAPVPWFPYECLSWQNQYVMAVQLCQPQVAGQRLCELLRRRPARAFASAVAGMMGREKRYETAPILMRYALEGEGWSSLRCTHALAEMGVPQAALGILRMEAKFADRKGAGDDFPVQPENQEKLRKLLDRDAGTSFQAWCRLYEQTIASRPCPLPPAARQELDRTITCLNACWLAQGELLRVQVDLYERRLAAAGMFVGTPSSGSSQSISPSQTPRRNLLTYRHPVRGISIGGPDHCWMDVLCDTDVRTPQFTKPTIEAMQEDVAAYVARVEKVVAKYGSPATAPAASGPESGPATQRRE